MAGRRGVIRATGIASTTSAKTVGQITAPANQSLIIERINVSFHGQSNTDEPIEVEFVRQSTAGTGGTSTPPTNKDDGWGGTLQATGLTDIATEPTGTVVVETIAVHPQTGLLWEAFERGSLMVDEGTRLGVRVNAATGVDVDVAIHYEE